MTTHSGQPLSNKKKSKPTKRAKRHFMEAFRLVCQKRKAGHLSSYIMESLHMCGLDELDIALDGMDQFQLPLFCEALQESSSLGSANITLNQKPERGCRGHRAKALRRGRSTGMRPGAENPEATTKLMRSLARNMAANKRMQWLRLHGLPMHRLPPLQVLNKAFVACKHSLRALALCECGVTDAGFKAIADSLRDMAGLSAIRISGCKLTDASAPTFTNMIQTNALRRVDFIWSSGLCNGRSRDEYKNSLGGLKIVEFPNNELGDGVADALARALRMDASIARLDLSGNQIGRDGALKLRDMRLNNTTLSWLSLKDNPGILVGAPSGGSNSLLGDPNDNGSAHVPIWPLKASVRHPEGCNNCISCKEGRHIKGVRKKGIDVWEGLMREMTRSMRHVTSIFRDIDKDGSGAIDSDELRLMLVELDYPVSDEEFEVILNRFDEDGSGEIEFGELKAAVVDWKDQRKLRLQQGSMHTSNRSDISPSKSAVDLLERSKVSCSVCESESMEDGASRENSPVAQASWDHNPPVRFDEVLVHDKPYAPSSTSNGNKHETEWPKPTNTKDATAQLEMLAANNLELMQLLQSLEHNEPVEEDEEELMAVLESTLSRMDHCLLDLEQRSREPARYNNYMTQGNISY